MGIAAPQMGRRHLQPPLEAEQPKTATGPTLTGRIIALFEAQDTGEGLTKQDIEKGIGGRAQLIREAVDELHSNGRIEPHGRRWRLARTPLEVVVAPRDDKMSSHHADDRDE